MSLRVEFVTKENVLVVRFEGELDHHETSKLHESWRGQLQQNDVDHVVVNLEKLNFMDSSGLGVMLGRYKEVQASGNEMIICSISPEVRRLFDLSGMFKIMRLVDSESYALELLGGGFMRNEMTLEFLSVSENESLARVAVAAFISQMNPTMEELTDIKTVVSEAVTNAIIHGYEENPHQKVMISCAIEGEQIEIIIKDEGKGISDIEEAKEPLFTSKPEWERSGMGFTIMENFMDKVDVTSEPDSGTTIRMMKQLTSTRALCN